MLPRKTLKLYVAKHAISCIFVSSVRENELFMFLKLIVPSSPVLLLQYKFKCECSAVCVQILMAGIRGYI